MPALCIVSKSLETIHHAKPENPKFLKPSNSLLCPQPLQHEPWEHRVAKMSGRPTTLGTMERLGLGR